MLTIELPWPPTINLYWRHSRGRHFIATSGIEYRRYVCFKCIQYKNYFDKNARLSVDIKGYPPDNRRRDIDNILKVLLDSLQHATVYKDDSQIDKITITRFAEHHGKVIVTLDVI